MNNLLRILLVMTCLSAAVTLSMAQWVTSFFPDSGETHADTSTIIRVTFSVDVDTTTLTSNSFRPVGAISGEHAGKFAYNTTSRTVSMKPDVRFAIGETVAVTLTTEIRNTAGDTMPSSFSWNFKIDSYLNPGLFLPSSVVAVDSGPWGPPVAGDWDGNGTLDLAVPCRWSATVVILKNDGLGNFTLSQRIKVDARPLGLAAGDFDGDGALDLAVANWIGNTVQILHNDGSGSFNVSQSIPVGAQPQAVAVGDLDHDGDSDLVVTNNGGITINILENDGRGIFTRLAPITVESGPISVVVTDLNRDGNEDIAVANLYSSSVSILKNQGMGNFIETGVLGVGPYPTGIVCGDWNKDGNMDLASINNGDGSVSILFGDDSAYFSKTSTHVTDVTYGRPLSATAGDWNGDGNKDIAIADGDWNAVLVLVNDGKGNFRDSARIAVAGSAYGIVSGDWDGDGDLDLAVTHDVQNSISILKNQTITSGVADRRKKISSSFSLFRNYPNPFNPSTKIAYAIPKPDNVVLKIYDVLGREVATLVDEKKQPGEYTIVWNACDLASGVYFYRLVAGDFVQTRRMILMR